MIQQVWLRFWQAAANGQLQFRSLEAALSYLRMATVSTVIEAQKLAWRQAREVALVGAAGEEERPGSVPNNTSLQLGSNDTPFDAIQRALPGALPQGDPRSASISHLLAALQPRHGTA